MAALQPPTFEHEGIVYVGVYVSIREWMKWMDKVDEYGANKLKLHEVLHFHKQLCRVWFPGEKRKRWWGGRGESPVWEILEGLPLVVQVDAITSFLVSQAALFGMQVPTVPLFGSEAERKTSGTRPSNRSPSLKKETKLTG